MLKPQDVFVRFVDFKVWLLDVSFKVKHHPANETFHETWARSWWDNGVPCVPGSYGIVIN